MNNKLLEPIEIYPNILVYKGLFKDIHSSYQVLLDSLVETEDRLFSPWTEWSIFGKYLNPIIPSYDASDKYGNFQNITTATERQEKERQLALEMMENFHLVTEDYIKRFNIDVDLNLKSVNEEGQEVPTWRYTGGTIGMYHKSNDFREVGMRYHSDYIREQGHAPGYKFVITCTIYYNDDYEGGEIDFVMGDKLVKYKPEAGDLLVFPSGHPEYLTEDGMPYLHGVMPSYNKNKFLSRMYWQKYQKGTDEWYEKEKEFGKDVWAAMQPQLEQEFRDKHPQREQIENGVRIK
jgi:2OG-Fe(II) oxygenase superfamily